MAVITVEVRKKIITTSLKEPDYKIHMALAKEEDDDVIAWAIAEQLGKDIKKWSKVLSANMEKYAKAKKKAVKPIIM